LWGQTIKLKTSSKVLSIVTQAPPLVTVPEPFARARIAKGALETRTR